LCVVFASLLVAGACRSTGDSPGQDELGAAPKDPAVVDGAATSVQRAGGPDTPAQPIDFEIGRPFTEVVGTVAAGLTTEYVFGAEEGQVALVSFARRPSGMLSLTLRAPDGSILADAVPEAVAELPQTGQYRLSVVGASDTDYTLYITKSTGSTRGGSERLTLETVATVDGTAAPGDIAQYSFTANSGRILGVQVSSPTGRYLTSVRTADGVVLVSFAESAFSGAVEILREIPESGSHVVSVLSLGAVDPTANTDYELRLSLREP
jgi:hypothetical protein